MKRRLILAGHRFLYWACLPPEEPRLHLPEALYDWYFDHVYGPWYRTLPDACDNCPACIAQRHNDER